MTNEPRVSAGLCNEGRHMQVTVEDITAVKKILHVEIPEEQVTRELDNAYNELKKQAKVKGFRPGKAPRTILERLYKRDVDRDVVSKLISDSFPNALEKTEMKIIGTPTLDSPDIEKNKPYRYNATVEVIPAFDEVDFRGIEVERRIYPISEEEVREKIEEIRQSMAEPKRVEEPRPLQEGDLAVLDYEGTWEGGPLEALQRTEGFTLQVGSGKILQDFERRLVGMQEADVRKIDVRFPEDYFNDALAGKQVSFHVTLKEIRELVLPQVDDAFAKSVGPYETMEDLRSAVRDRLREAYARRSEEEVDAHILETLVQRSPFELPATLVNNEAEAMVAETERALSARKMSLEASGATREGLTAAYQQTAEQRVRNHLILARIIEQENLTLSDEDMDKAFDEMAQSLRQPVEVVRRHYEKDQEQSQALNRDLLRRRAMALIKEAAVITEKVVDGEAESPA